MTVAQWKAVVIGVAAAAYGWGQVHEVRLVQPDSKLWIEGNSTLHAWSATATQLRLTGSAKPAEAPMRWNFTALTVTVPVRGLKSGTEGLDKNMYEDLKAARYPEITFRLKSCQPAGERGAEGIPVRVEGWLSIAGVEKLVSFSATWESAGQRIRVRGTAELNMTDFGIKPRTFMVVMKVDNRVVVHFDVVMEVL